MRAEPLTRVRVYTKEPDPSCYPEGLAFSVHLACETERGGWQPLNRDYGILFAEGTISERNTIVPMGVRNPAIFRLEDGRIGIAAERVREDGSPDETAQGSLLLWKTRDLIRFEPPVFVPRGTVPERDGADTLALEEGLVRQAARFWSPVVFTGADLPGCVRASSWEELDRTEAVLHYSDGSVRKKRVFWNRDTVCFDQAGAYHAEGMVRQQSFQFPLAKGYGDPVIFPWEGKWIYTSTNDNRGDIGLYVREASSVQALFQDEAEEHLILPFDPARGLEQTFWAPEFHVIGGELYILFAVSGSAWGPQCHMMKKRRGESAVQPAGWEDPVRVVRKDGSPLTENAITLDMTFVRADSGSYVVWSYREHIGTPSDTGSMLYIASIDEREPWKLTSDPVLLTRPLYGWENVAGTINNEGPHAFSENGKIYLTYSGGSADSYTYALGMLTADSRADLLDTASWWKSPVPVLTFRSVAGEYGPGHNSFFVNEEGELMIAYHAETELQGHLRCDGIRRVHFRKDGTPYFQMSALEDLTQSTVRTTVIVGK